MRFTTLFSVFSRVSRRPPAATGCARKSRLAAAERLEARINLTATIVDLAAPRAASGGYPAYDQLPIPAGATLVDVNDSGRYVLFSSTDTNVIAGQQTIPSINPDLFWLDTTTGQTRLVTHRAGSPVQSAGYAGLEGSKYFPGYGQWPMFEPLSADLSGDGRSVVFDSIIAANEYDAGVPVENDQATYRPLKRDATTDTWKNFQLGTVDVFVWRADGDAANNIALVSRLNAEGQQQAVAINALVPGLPVPQPGQPMATGVFAQEYLPVLPDNFLNLVQQDPQESLSLNKGISEDGTKVLYDSWVPAGWIDVVRPVILDQEAINVNALGQGAGSDWTLDSFVASTTGFGSGPWAAKTVTVNVDATQALGNYTGPAIGQGAWAEPFEPMFSQMSGDGKRVVYSTRRTSAEIVTGTTDSDFSLDVFASDVDSSTNLLVSRQWDDATKAAGSAQPNLFDGSVRPFVRNFVAELWDSQNHSVSNDGRTIAFTSSAGNLVVDWKDVTADFSEPVIVGGSKWTAFQSHPIDIYGFQFTSASPTVSTGKAVLVNSPDGLANTNRIATFGGMSADGSSFLFSTAANNFYLPGFTSPYPFTQNLPQAPLPINFILGGFDNLWMRRVDWAAGAKGITTLVSVGFNVDADGKPDINGKPTAAGNKATLGSATPAGSRDVLNTISESGRYVMFSSKANNLVQGISDRSFKGGVFVRDTVANRTTLLTTTATGNVPSAGVFVNSAIASDDTTSRFASYVDGTGANDMQTRFRTEDVAPALTSHIYRIDYPAVSNAAAATNPAVFSVASADFNTDVNTRPVLEFRNPIPLITPSVKTSPGQLLPNYAGEWRTATGDINADGVVDYVYGAGPGGRDTVVVVDGRTNSVIWQVAAMFKLVPGATGAAARPGVFVATTDVNCDGFADVIVGSAGARSSEVKIYDGRRGTLIRAFAPFGAAARVGVRVAGGDVDADGYGDVVASAGPGGGGKVSVYSGRMLTKGDGTLSLPNALLTSFAAKGGSGVFVAVADMNRDGKAELIIGFDKARTVSIYNGLNGTLISKKDLGTAFRTGVRVAARAGQVMVASADGVSPTIQLFAYAAAEGGGEGVWTLRSNLANEKISGFTKSNTRGLYVG